MEPGVWEYLVHRQFIAEKFSPCDIDASFARRFSDSIILDNRCPHAGDRWPRRASSLYWWHFYGFQRNIALQELEMTVGFWARGDACLTPPPSTGTPKAAGGAAVTVRCPGRSPSGHDSDHETGRAPGRGRGRPWLTKAVDVGCRTGRGPIAQRRHTRNNPQRETCGV